MRFYIAAHIESKEVIDDISRKILERRHEMILELIVKGDDLAPQHSQKLRSCDVFVLIPDDRDHIGTNSQLGSALLSCRYGKPKVYVIGKHEKESVLYSHPLVNLRGNFDQVLDETEKYQKKRELK